MYHILGVEEDESLQEVVKPLQNLRGLDMAERQRRKGLRTDGKDKRRQRRKGLRTDGRDKKPEQPLRVCNGAGMFRGLDYTIVTRNIPIVSILTILNLKLCECSCMLGRGWNLARHLKWTQSGSST